MQQEALAPTLERLHKARAYIAPEISQKAKREYYRVRDEFEQLRDQGAIDPEQFLAARKLQLHWYGAQGVNVRHDDGPSGYSDVCEYPRTYHAQKLAEAESALTGRMWAGAMILLEEIGGPDLVGTAVCRRKDPRMARAAGLELVQNALDLLARLWGISQRHRPPSR